MTEPTKHEVDELRRALRKAQVQIENLTADRDIWAERARAAWADRPMAPTLFDEWIAERWPNDDPAEIRRRFDALIAKLGETMWRGIPRWPDAMIPVLAWAAMLPAQRIEALTAALANVPEYLRDLMWSASKPAFGEQRVKFMEIAGDNGHGMGRQAVAITPYIKGYNLAPWIAAASPGNVGALLAELERLRIELSEARKDTNRLDFLDRCNRALNGRYGTNYGWKLIRNHNVNRLMSEGMEIDLHDSEGGTAKLPSCRAAIDAQMPEQGN